jgi:hypothetical protein
MSQSFSRKITLIATGFLSLISQGILLIPTTLGFFFPFFSQAARSFAVGSILFVFSMVFFVAIISTQLSRSRLEWRRNIILLLTQGLTVIGMYFLVDGMATREQETGFLLSSLVTIVTTYGIFSHMLSVEQDHGQPAEEAKPISTDLSFDPGRNLNALKEQIETLTRQITVEKHRATQLTLLNELSQQLEAELDPPVSAQLAVNTLERAMECSLVALMAPDGERQDTLCLHPREE